MQNAKLAIFYCGTNGAGKSTLRSFNQDNVQVVIDSDHIAMQLNPSDPRQADLEAGRTALELFKFSLKQQISFSMESTLSGQSILQRMSKAKAQGFFTRLNYVGVDDVSINLERVATRVRMGGHFIDEETIRKRYIVSNQNLMPAILNCDETLIYDNSTDRPNLILFIDQYKNIIEFTDDKPVWCENLLAKLTSI